MTFLYSIFGIRKIMLVISNLVFNLTYSRILGHKINIFGWPIIQITKGSNVKVGKNLTLISHAYFSGPGVNHPVILRTISEQAQIMIGDDVGISGGGIAAKECVVLGNSVMLGANTFITDTDFHTLDKKNRRYATENITSAPVHIANNVFIGMDSLVLKGVSIGTNAIIGARSVVTKNIPPNCIAAGNPAKVIKQI